MRTRLSSPPTGAIYRKCAGRVRWYLPALVLKTGTKHEYSPSRPSVRQFKTERNPNKRSECSQHHSNGASKRRPARLLWREGSAPVPTQKEPRQQPHRHKRRWRCQMQMRAGHNARRIQSGLGRGWECGRASFLRTGRQSFTSTTFRVLPASSGLGVFRFDLCRATFDLVVILGVIPVVAAAVVVFANGRRINSRLFTPGILWSASPW